MATVSALIHYPVKGCAGLSVPRLDITPTGPVHDRTFMFVTPEGLFRSQRTTSRLAVVRPDLVHDGAKLTLSAPGHPDVAVAVRPDGERVPVTVHVWTGRGIDQGDDAAEWGSAVLGEPVRLMRVPPDHERQVDATHGTITYTDSTPLHLTSLSSLDDLNARILARGAEPVPMARFRPNIVVSGWDPFAEDDAREIRVGGAELRYVKPDVRCKVTMVDQDAGTPAGPEPIRTLGDFRREPDGGVSFGIKLAVRTPGAVSVGDTLDP
ncbi:MAG: MOSC domain-containing protein [Actinophytocola sp.]|uniref:MOSC domain-containing protein n=1 Tax=Actinophytocola sp. TaxID=1872138 RepID=UPI00132C54D2|nr:MOSC N-terminal beta barrel domain-containing protein [Actinophytocola sp.]MPZ79921.1 MOSC domain-containing protein [Actinophytocola sp.]